MSLGANCLASSTTWVDSALFGSQAEESFCWALLSLPASGPAKPNTAIQKATTTNLVQRPAGKVAIPRAAPMLPPRCAGSSPPAPVRLAAFRNLPEISMVRPPIASCPQACELCLGAPGNGSGTARWCCVYIDSSVGACHHRSLPARAFGAMAAGVDRWAFNGRARSFKAHLRPWPVRAGDHRPSNQVDQPPVLDDDKPQPAGSDW